MNRSYLKIVLDICKISPLTASSCKQYLANQPCISQKLTTLLMALLQVVRGEKRGFGCFGTHLAILIRQKLNTGKGLYIPHWCKHCCRFALIFFGPDSQEFILYSWWGPTTICYNDTNISLSYFGILSSYITELHLPSLVLNLDNL